MNSSTYEYGTNPYNKQQTAIYSGLLSVLWIVGIITYGVHVLWIGIVATLTSILVEYLFAKLRNQPLGTGFVLTPLLFILLLPPTLPLWMVAVGASFGTFFAKGLFGGDGKYIFHPAVVGLLFITISFPAFLNTMWLNPVTGDIQTGIPLISLANDSLSYNIVDLLLGQTPGPLGVTFRLGILIIGGILIGLNMIDWKIVVTYLGSFFLFTLLLNQLAPDTARDAVTSIFVGSVLFVSFFIATDPVTAPIDWRGRVIYGIGLGFITVIIRHFAAFPEGVIFAVVIMNAVAPLLDDTFTNTEVKNDE